MSLAPVCLPRQSLLYLTCPNNLGKTKGGVMGKHPDPQRLLRVKKGLAQGQLKPCHVELAAFLGDADALATVEEEPDAPPDLMAWGEVLRERHGQHVCSRAMIAWARAALLLWDKPPLPKNMVPRLRLMPYELLAAVEQLVLSPNEITNAHVVRLLAPAREEPSLLADDDLLHHATILSLVVSAATGMVEKWITAFNEARDDARHLWNEHTIKRIAAVELIPWTLAESDALAKRPTRVPS